MKPAACFSLLALSACLTACAGAPERQADRHRRFDMAGTRVIAVLDGVQPEVSNILTNIAPERVREALAAAGEADPASSPVNAFVLMLGERVVLVDAGGGSGLPGYRGMLAERLRGAGVEPSQVTDILITHMHADHVGGLSEAGRALYPHATVHVHASEARFWLAPGLPARAPEQFRPVILAIQAAVAPYLAAGRLKTFEDGAQVVPEVFARSASGHTQGHTVFLWRRPGSSSLFWGDLIHVAGVQLAHPEAGVRFDARPADASGERQRWLSESAQQGWTVFGAHMPFPGVGRVVRQGDHYRWTPAVR